MKKLKLIMLSVLAIATLNPIFAQLHMAGFGGSQGFFKTNDLDISNSLSGGHAFIETPLGKCSFRGDFNYLVRLGEKKINTSNIDNLTVIRLGYGKIIGEGKRFQIPLFGAAGILSSTGDLKLKSWSAGVRAGFRLFITEKIALHLDATGDYVIAQKVKFNNQQGIESDVSTKPIYGQINIGFTYMYNQKKKN